MHAVGLINAALSSADADYPDIPEQAPEPGVCCVTGVECQTWPRHTLLGPSWTQHDLLARPDSQRVGVAAYVALRYKWERMSSWLCDGERFVRLDRVGVRNAVFCAKPCRPWAGYATTTYKKHGAMLAPVNPANGCSNRWLWDTEVIDLSDQALVMEHWQRLNAALRAGIGRSAIETLECPAWLLPRIGISVWMEFARWAKTRYRSGLYRFMSYLLPSQEELRAGSNA